MRKAFVDMLISEGVLPSADAKDVGHLLRGAPEPIGSIAFNYGMITGSHIDEILDEQRRSRMMFGEIAIERGILTRTQVEALLQVQQIRAVTGIAEAMALSRRCSIDEVVAHLGRFFSQKTETAIRSER